MWATEDIKGELGAGHADVGPAAVAGAVEFVQVGEDDDMALHAFEFEDGGGPEGALFVRLSGVVRRDLEAPELGGAGVGLLPCPAHAQNDDIHGEILVQDLLGQDDVKQLEFLA